jgi:hypothetical protein
MRSTITAALAKAIKYEGFIDYGQFELSDALVLLMSNEKAKHANGEPGIGLSQFVRMINECYEEEAIHEYVALNQHFIHREMTDTKLKLIRGLHLPERNREWMDSGDPASVQRNTVLLQSINLLRHEGSPQLLNEALENVHAKQSGQIIQGFRDAECVDLLLDNPDQAETLIITMVERGYKSGMDAFREMLNNNTPALGNGVL